MTKPTSSQADIRPLFTQRDVQAMSKAFNLASYDDVMTHAAGIYDRELVMRSCRPYRREEKVLGRNLGLNYLLNGWRMVANLRQAVKGKTATHHREYVERLRSKNRWS
jgi:hypothetical protein